MTSDARNDDGLPRLFGYEQLRQIYGWRRRTIEKAMRDGKLRRPMMIGKRAFWYASDIDDYLSRLRGDLEALAVGAPEEIPEDKLGSAIQALTVRLAALHGDNIAPDDIDSITIGKKLTEDEVARVRYAEWETFWRLAYARFEADNLSYEDAVALAYLLFPAIRAHEDKEITALGREVRMPRGLSPLELALVILSTPPEERARFREERARRRVQGQTAAE